MVEKKKRGFACMTPERRREIAAMGGRAVPAEKRAYAQDRELARAAGLKGGLAQHVSRGGFSDLSKHEVWKGDMLAKVRRLHANGKSLTETRHETGSQLTLRAFRHKCRKYGIVFEHTWPVKK